MTSKPIKAFDIETATYEEINRDNSKKGHYEAVERNKHNAEMRKLEMEARICQINQDKTIRELQIKKLKLELETLRKPYEQTTCSKIVPGVYLIKTAGCAKGKQEVGWGLTAHESAKRDPTSTWLCAHKGENYMTRWIVRNGSTPNTYRIAIAYKQHGCLGLRGLTTWSEHGARRDEHSSRVAAHDNENWICEWEITPGKKGYVIKTVKYKDDVHTWKGEAITDPAYWFLTSWRCYDGERNTLSNWVYVHDSPEWQSEWTFEYQSDIDDMP